MAGRDHAARDRVMSPPRDPRLLVVAVGGRALRATGGRVGLDAWRRSLEPGLGPLADLVAAGLRLVLTHGRGPSEDERVPIEPRRRPASPVPFELHRAGGQALAGYAIQQALENLCRVRNVETLAVVVPTRVRVDPDDPAFERPTRPVGPRYTVGQARRLARERGWTFAGSPAQGRRRIVPSPRPRDVLEAPAIRRLVDAGLVVVAAGSGGVAVVTTPLGHHGVEAVLQEDATAAVLGTRVGADRLVLATGVDRVEVGHRTRSIGIERLTVADARALLAAGEFPPVSMGPKIQAAIEFVEAGGREALVTSLSAIREALDGRAGTRVVP
jgi:carbamate kinase